MKIEMRTCKHQQKPGRNNSFSKVSIDSRNSSNGLTTLFETDFSSSTGLDDDVTVTFGLQYAKRLVINSKHVLNKDFGIQVTSLGILKTSFHFSEQQPFYRQLIKFETTNGH